MAIARKKEADWVFKWKPSDLKKIDDKSLFFRSAGAIDDYSAWTMAEQEYYHSTRSCAGFMAR